jgi:PEP-CTERM motif
LNSWASNASAGSNFDQLKGLSGAKLDLTGVSNANPVVLKISSLNGTTPGSIPAFDANQGRSWVIADFSNGNTSGGIQGFSADKFLLDTSNFANDPNSTAFWISLDANSNKVILTFTPVPEPASVVLIAGLAGAGVLGVRRRFTRRPSARVVPVG